MAPHILTDQEAADLLRCEVTDPNMLLLLPLVDTHIKNATGRDWAADDPIEPTAKTAAMILLVRWHEDPGGMAGAAAPSAALTSLLVQLEAIALELAAGVV